MCRRGEWQDRRGPRSGATLRSRLRGVRRGRGRRGGAWGSVRVAQCSNTTDSRLATLPSARRWIFTGGPTTSASHESAQNRHGDVGHGYAISARRAGRLAAKQPRDWDVLLLEQGSRRMCRRWSCSGRLRAGRGGSAPARGRDPSQPGVTVFAERAVRRDRDRRAGAARLDTSRPRRISRRCVCSHGRARC